MHMDITGYVEQLRAELSAAAAPGGEEMVAAADRLSAALDASVRMALLEALSDAAAEITAALDALVVEVRLKGREPQFVVEVAEPRSRRPMTSASVPADGDDDASTARITLRLPEALKQRAEDSAARSRQSLNTWLVDADPPGHPSRRRHAPAARHRPPTLRVGSLTARPTHTTTSQHIHEEHDMHRFTTPVPPRLTIDVRAGIVTIDTADVTETTVDLQPRHDSPNAREVIAASTVEQRGDEIIVRVPRRHGGLFGRAAEIAVTIVTPAEPALAIETGVGGRHRHRPVRHDTVARGAATSRSARSPTRLRIRSGSGDVHVRSVAGDLDAQTGSGDVRVDALGGAGSVQSGSGDITLGDCGRAVRVKTGSGDVTVGTAPDDLEVNTASGDIRIDAIEHGEVSAKAASGDIRAGVRHGTAAWLDVRSIAGRITSALDADRRAGCRRAEGAARVGDGERRHRTATGVTGRQAIVTW